MQSRDFCFWLQGFFELNAASAAQIFRSENHMGIKLRIFLVLCFIAVGVGVLIALSLSQ